jgi:hypothetical protein
MPNMWIHYRSVGCWVLWPSNRSREVYLARAIHRYFCEISILQTYLQNRHSLPGAIEICSCCSIACMACIAYLGKDSATIINTIKSQHTKVHAGFTSILRIFCIQPIGASDDLPLRPMIMEFNVME